VSEQQQDWRPVPDPTLLTTQQLLREMGALRELLESRLDAMDRAATVLSETVNRTPTAIQTAVANMEAVYTERFAGVQSKFDERGHTFDVRFHGIAQQFAERDVRTGQAQQASDQALNAALQAAKELVNAQGEASAAAAVKSETSFTKQIDQIGTIISTLEKALDARITELKERIDRGEGTATGGQDATTSARLNVNLVISVVLALATVITLVLYATKK
jgi:hypothetical protein